MAQQILTDAGAASILISLDQGCIKVTHGETGDLLAKLDKAPSGSWDNLWDYLTRAGIVRVLELVKETQEAN